MDKIITQKTYTTDGANKSKMAYFIAPTVKEMVEKINEIVEWINTHESNRS